MAVSATTWYSIAMTLCASNAAAQMVFRIQKAISGQTDKPENFCVSPWTRWVTCTRRVTTTASSSSIPAKASSDRVRASTGSAPDNSNPSSGIAVAPDRTRVHVSDLKGVQAFDPDSRYLGVSKPSGGFVHDITFNDKSEMFGFIGNKVYKLSLPK